jgi:hypothetical protein
MSTPTYNEVYDLLTQLADKHSAKITNPDLRESFKVGYLKVYLVEVIKDDPKLFNDLRFSVGLDL